MLNKLVLFTMIFFFSCAVFASEKYRVLSRNEIQVRKLADGTLPNAIVTSKNGCTFYSGKTQLPNIMGLLFICTMMNEHYLMFRIFDDFNTGHIHHTERIEDCFTQEERFLAASRYLNGLNQLIKNNPTGTMICVNLTSYFTQINYKFKISVKNVGQVIQEFNTLLKHYY